MKPTIIVVFAAFMVSACSGAQSPSTETPSAGEPPESESAEVDAPAARQVLEQFLTARWALDQDTALAFVTEVDRDNVWPFAFEPQALQELPEQTSLEAFYDWKIISLEEDGETATAVVEVLVATHVEVGFWQRTIRDLIEPDPWTYEDLEVAEARATSLLPDTLPPRIVVPMKYRLVREDGDWRVQMGWKHFPREAPNPGLAIPAAKDFEGSEKWWLDVWATSIFAVPIDKMMFRKEVRDAESVVGRRLYGLAIARYEKMEPAYAAELISDRIDALRRGEVWWSEKVAGGNLSFEPKYRTVLGYITLEVDVENRGASDLRDIRFEVWTNVEGQATLVADFKINRLNAGEQKTLQLTSEGSTPNAEGPLPDDLKKSDIDKVHVRRMEFIDAPREQPYESSDDFDLRVFDALTDGSTKRAAWRIYHEVMQVRNVRLKCPGWPDEPFRARLSVDEGGAIADVELSAGDRAFSRCVFESLAAVEFAPGEPVTVVVDMLPPRFLQPDN